MIASVHITRRYGENARNFGLINIFMFFRVSNGTLELKLTASARVHVITHSQDLDESFPENELLKDQQ